SRLSRAARAGSSAGNRASSTWTRRKGPRASARSSSQSAKMRRWTSSSGAAAMACKKPRSSPAIAASSTAFPDQPTGAVFGRDAEFAQALPDQVRLSEQGLLDRVVLAGNLLGLGPQVVPQVDEQLHQPAYRRIVAGQRGCRRRRERQAEYLAQLLDEGGSLSEVRPGLLVARRR